MRNQLYYGDNLDVLRRHVRDETVDLVYLDPPFNSNANYNVLFAAKDGHQAAAQIQVFEDTWRWDESAARQFAEVVEAGGKVADVLLAFERIIGASDMLAYLAMMAPRLVELRRVLRPTGSLYLHCDPSASHYLKLLLDAVFGPENFRNEIIWNRTTNTGSSKATARRFATDHDIIFAYARNSDECKFNTQYRDYSEDYIRRYYTNDDSDGRGPYQIQALRTYSADRLKELQSQNRIVPGKGRVLRFKDYLRGKKGVAINDIWTDIEPVNPAAREKLGYPTQKPVALLERIIEASSNPGDVVLDPFCGCGTTIDAAQKLGRPWIGIDITHLAINLIKKRLRDTYGDAVKYQVVGEPTTVEDAEQLARSDPYQFQWWALGLVGARPAEQKKGADRGIDGRLYFHIPGGPSKTEQIVLSVKGGHVTVSQVRDLRGVVEREKAAIGVLISFEQPTQPMRREAAGAGFFQTPWGRHPRLQILTVGELLAGASIDYPRTAGINRTYRGAPKAKKVAEPHPELFDDKD